MWKVAWFYEKVHNIASFRGYTAILMVPTLVENSKIFCILVC